MATADQRLKLCEKVIGNVVFLEMFYTRSKGEIRNCNRMFSGVLIDKQTILTRSLEKITSESYEIAGKKPETVQIDYITARLDGEVTCRRVDAKLENGFLTILKPVDKDVQFPTCAEMGNSRSIEMGLPVYSFCHANQQEFSFLHGEVSHQKVTTPGINDITYAQLNNIHATCLGCPVFNSDAKLIGIITFISSSFNMMIRAGTIEIFLGRWAGEQKRMNEEEI